MGERLLSKAPTEAYMVSEKESFEFGTHRYARDMQLDLEKETKALSKISSKIRYLHLYCDTLVCPSKVSLNLSLPADLWGLTIFAREFLLEVSELTINWPGGNSRHLFVYCDKASPDLVLKGSQTDRGVALMHRSAECANIKLHDHIAAFDLPASDITSQPIDGTTPLDVLLRSARLDNDTLNIFAAQAPDAIAKMPSSSPSCIGRYIEISNGKLMPVRVLDNVPPLELQGPSLADIVLSKEGSDMGRIENLSKLLNTLFVRVSKNVFISPASTDKEAKDAVSTTVSSLRFIINCSRSSIKHASLTADAQKLLDRIELPVRFPGMLRSSSSFYVPHLDFEDLLRNASEAADLVKGIEDQISNTDKEITGLKETKELIGVVIGEMGKDVKGFIDTDANMTKAKEAVVDCEQRRRDMTRYVDATATAMRTFQEGVKAYEAKKRSEFWMSIIGMIAELVVGVGVAIATCGAGSAVTIGTLGKAQKAITEGVKLWDKITTFIKKLCDTVGKLLPKLMSAFSNQASTQKLMQFLNDRDLTSVSASRRAAENSLKSGSVSDNTTTRVDYLDLLADWDEFENDVDATFEQMRAQLGTETIDGMTEYKVSLKNQAVRGRLVVVAMRNVQEAQQFYRRQEAERVAREGRSKEMLRIAQDLKTKEQADTFRQALRWDLIQQNINGRRTLFVRVHQALLSLIYCSNKPSTVIKIFKDANFTSVTNPGTFKSALKTAMKDEYDNVKTHDVVIEAPFEVMAEKHKNYVFNADWKEVLKSDQKLYFKIPYQGLKGTQSQHHLRIREMSAILEGPKLDQSRLPEWDWELGPNMVDKDADHNPIPYYMPTRILPQRGGKNQFVDRFGRLPKPSLFIQGRIVFKPLEEDEIPGQPAKTPSSKDFGVDFDKVTDIKLQFWCDVRYKDGSTS